MIFPSTLGAEIFANGNFPEFH